MMCPTAEPLAAKLSCGRSGARTPRAASGPDCARSDPRTPVSGEQSCQARAEPGPGNAMKNTVSLRLHIPQPPARPGDKPDFSNVALPEAGAIPRPEIDVQPSAIRDMAYTLVRVLDGDGNAVGPWNPRLDPETLRRGLKAMI